MLSLNDRSSTELTLSRVFRLSLRIFLSRLFFSRVFLFLHLINGNFYQTLGPILFCSVCAGNATWKGRLVPCCASPKWLYLRCAFLSSSEFNSFSSSHSWSYLSGCISAFLGASSRYTSTADNNSLNTPSANGALPSCTCLQTFYFPLALS